MADATPKEKEAWLESLLSSSSAHVVDVDAFLVVLNAFGESSESGAPQRAEHWIIRLEHFAKDHGATNPNVRSTVACYRAVMKAWGNAMQEERNVALNRAERWLNAMYEMQLQPTTECYNTLLNICSHGRGHSHQKRDITETLAMKAEDIFSFMLEQYHLYGNDSPIIPNTDSLNYVIRAWTRCRRHPNVADRVLHLLSHFQQVRIDDSIPLARPDTKSYCMALDALAITARMKAHRCPKNAHDDITLNGLQEIHQIEHLIEYMHERCSDGDVQVKPCTVAYNTLLSAWARLSGPIHPDAPFEAEKILRRMFSLPSEGIEAFPDATSYSKVMLAWRNSTRSNAGERAAWWLQKQWQDYTFTRNPTIKPTLSSYNTMIQTWAKFHQPLEAEEFLKTLLDHEKDGDEEMMPDSESFVFVINAWLSCEGSDRYTPGYCLQKALHWLYEAMARENAGVKAPSCLLLSILKAARKSAFLGPDLLVDVSQVFDKYHSKQQVGWMEYSMLLHLGLETLRRPDHDGARAQFITKLIEKCREDGLVSNYLVRALANSVALSEGWTVEESARLTYEHFPHWPLPYSWYRHVPPEYHPSPNDTRRTHQSHPY